MNVRRVGLIINPIAGMGGRVGLKGTDTSSILEEAVKRGAKPLAQKRAKETINNFVCLKDKIEVVTYPHKMGEDALTECGFSPRIMGSISELTSASDTKRAAQDMLDFNVDLLLFTGGDGTARDVYSVIGDSLVVLGIPAGVKIHSAVYACNPVRAGELTVLYLEKKVKRIVEAEVMDIDEDSFRRGVLSAKLYGYMRIPFEEKYTQKLKAGSPVTEKYNQEALACEVVENMSDEFMYIIGPGSTTAAIMENLGLDYSLLGVDLVFRKKLVGKDLSESDLVGMIKGKKTKLVITPIGGQGSILGRGNQQVSPEVINETGKENIIIVATKQKIHSLYGCPLLVDTGEPVLDQQLRGYYRIITGYKEYIIYRVG